MCFSETLRKYPGGGFVERIANEDYTVRKGGHKIDKGASLLIPIWAIHNDPDIYPEPTRFDPDRMTQEKINKRPQGSFIPFSMGPRACPAQRLVNLKVKLGIISLLSNFRMSINDRTKPREILHRSPIAFEAWLNVEPL